MIRRRQFVQMSLGTMAALWATGCGDRIDSAGGTTPGGISPPPARFRTDDDYLFETDGVNRVFKLEPYRGQIFVEDLTGRRLLELRGVTNPFSLGVASDGRIYVLDRGQGDVAVFDSDGTLRQRIGGGRLEGAFQMAVGDVELYLLSALAGAVLVFDLSGQLVRRIALTDRVFYRDLAVAPNGELHVLQASPPVVEVFSPSGTPVRTYGPGPGISGRSLSIDSQGVCLVADALGEALYLYDAAGNFLQSISRAGLQPLQGLTASDGTLFVLVQETN